jgi:hypothetical protein
MADSHRHLNITPQEWDAFMDDFQQTLDKFKVPAVEQAELRAIVQSTYADIVVAKVQFRSGLNVRFHVLHLLKGTWRDSGLARETHGLASAWTSDHSS